MSARRPDRPGLLVDAVLLCYPRAWRDRYADEVLSLATVLHADGNSPHRTAFDLLRAAPSAWARRIAGAGAPGNARPMRGVVQCAWGLLLLIIGGLAFAKLQDDPVLIQTTPVSSLATWGFRLAVVGGLAAGAVTLLAAIAPVRSLWRAGPSGRRALGGLLVVPVAGLACMAALVVAKTVAAGRGSHSAPTLLAVALLALVGAVAGLAVTVGVLGVAGRVPETPANATARRLGALGLVGCALLVLAGAIAWAVGIATQDRTAFGPSDGLFATPMWASVAAIAPCLLLACVLSALGLRSAWSDTRRLD